MIGRIGQITLLVILFSSTQGYSQTPSKELATLFQSEWDNRLKEFPDVSTIYGYKLYNNQWPDYSLAAFEKRQKARLAALEKLKKIDHTKLSAKEKFYAQIFKSEYEIEAESHRKNLHLMPLNQMEGIHDLTPTLSSISFDALADYESWQERLDKLPFYIDQTIDLMKEGIRVGRVQSQTTMKRVPPQLKRLIAGNPENHPLYKPFRKFPATISQADQFKFAIRGKVTIQKRIIPAYQKMLDFIEKEYLPKCYEGIGVWHLQDGETLYPFQVKLQTTTNLTPDEIHEIGQKEVKRIQAEMEKVMQSVEFKGTFQEFVTKLRNDPKNHYQSEQEILESARAICSKAESQLPKLFGRLPKTRYLIEAIPAHMAPDSTSAYYLWPSADGKRPGTYYVNLYQPKSRPKYQMEALSMHECIPGHHLQLSLAFELEGVPAFRRFSLGYNAYVEGWALYSESLGSQLGMYQDPYSKFGQLSYEIWRAVRLVVDTGMHHKKWTRQQAIDFAVAHSASSLPDIENEIDRYATWPGQALGYKIGELKIKELRKRAETKLGNKFDIRQFHDTVLGTGSIPLDILENLVDEWIQKVGNKK